jgi:predicted ATP-grasp superfamily ATP-dependent carboligase
LREKPPSGGVSVLSESIEVDFQQREAATKILDSAKWHGVAMVEYKVASDGRPYLIEINPRFWGSLQLAIDAGIDFPELLYQLAIGGKLDVANSYKIGTKSRWLLGDLDHLYLTFRNGRSHGDRRASKWKTVIEFLNVSGESTRFEVNRWNDLSPFVFELRQYLRKR